MEIISTHVFAIKVTDRKNREWLTMRKGQTKAQLPFVQGALAMSTAPHRIPFVLPFKYQSEGGAPQEGIWGDLPVDPHNETHEMSSEVKVYIHSQLFL